MKHFWAYYDVVVNGYPVALVLEDDVQPCPTAAGDALPAVLDMVVNALPAAWDIVLLGSPFYGFPEHCPKEPITRQELRPVKENRQAGGGGGG